MQTGAVSDLTSNLTINQWPALPPDLQPSRTPGPRLNQSANVNVNQPIDSLPQSRVMDVRLTGDSQLKCRMRTYTFLLAQTGQLFKLAMRTQVKLQIK